LFLAAQRYGKFYEFLTSNRKLLFFFYFRAMKEIQKLINFNE